MFIFALLIKHNIMEELRKQHNILLNQIDFRFQRYAVEELPWEERMIGIKGSRGVGKTTLLLQYIKQNYAYSEEALYISLDNLYFTDNLFSDLVDDFVNKGGKHIFIDDVHKYPEWAIELKNIYNLHSRLKLTFAGSSLLQAFNLGIGLSQGVLVLNLPGISFREYLNYTLKTEFEVVHLEEILEYHTPIALGISKKIKPLKYFEEYIKYGYYPFFISSKEFYYQKLQEIINMTIEIELPVLRGVDPVKTRKIKQLLFIIAQSVPFKPNISKLADKIGITRNTLNEYLKYLVDARLLSMLNKDASEINLLKKPDKIFLENTSIAHAVSGINPAKENLRKTFFLNQLNVKHQATYPEKGDFLIDNKYLFEIGGKNKTNMQISGIKDAYIAVDDIEFGYENRIPLWLFGFLY